MSGLEIKSCNFLIILDSNEVEKKVQNLISLFNSLDGEVDKSKLVHPDIKKKEAFAGLEVMEEAFAREEVKEDAFFSGENTDGSYLRLLF